MPEIIAKMLADRKLTRKQRRFIVAYLKCLTGSEAARWAGYSPRSAHQQAYENLRKPNIKRIIERALNLRYCTYAVDPKIIDRF